MRAEYGPDPLTGRREQRSKTFLARREAEAYLTRWQAEIEHGIALEPGTVTVGEQCRYWLDTYARTSVSPQTFSEYERIVRSHILPALGAVPLQKLTVAHLEAFKGELLARGLATRTVAMCLMRLRQMLAQAIDLHLIAANPTACVQKPRVSTRRGRTWTTEQARRFLAVAGRSAYGPIWAVYLGSGMRRGEALGLRWRDVDVKHRTLRVEQTVGLERGRTVVKPKPKTEASRRTLAVDAAIIKALVAHRERQQEQRARAGDGWREHELVFATTRGTPINPNNLHREFGRLAAEAAHAHHPGDPGRRADRDGEPEGRARAGEHHHGHLRRGDPGHARRCGGSDWRAAVRAGRDQVTTGHDQIVTTHRGVRARSAIKARLGIG